MNSPYLISHNAHRYEVLKGWGDLNPNRYPVVDCHEMAVDKSGRIFLLTNDTRNNILIYNNVGKLKGNWVVSTPGVTVPECVNSVLQTKRKDSKFLSTRMMFVFMALA